MAYTTGTATDYKALLIALRDYIISVPAGSNWVTERDTSGGAPDQYEMIFKGDGGATDEIFWGVETYYDTGAGRHNWRVRGFTGFNTLETFDNQPGTSDDTYVPLQNASMDYWFYVTGRRVCAVIKTGSAYQFLYAGFIDQYSDPDEYPYPMLIMGSASVSTTVFNSNLLHYSSSLNPGSFDNTQTCAYLRDLSGFWMPVSNFKGTSSEIRFIVTDNIISVWPMSDMSAASPWEDTYDLANLFCSSTQGGTPATLIMRSANSAGTPVVPLISNCLLNHMPVEQIYGEIHNLYWCGLSDGVSAEDTVTDGVSADVFTVFNNIHRTDPWCGLAIKQE